MTDAKMKIWDAVEKTDPNYTKKVSQRGGFIAVSAAYQIKSATALFGPVGIGWGYVADAPIFHDKFVIVPVTLWYGNRENTFGPVYGCCEMLGQRPDSDAPKKAGTDAITKLLSQLGFNADVFLGKFDDNKYVAEVTKEFAEHPKAPPSDEERRDWAKDQIAKAPSKERLAVWWDGKKEFIESLPAPMQSELGHLCAKREEQLGENT